jgi:Di-haem oxidoreductase, putative peroxidase
VGSTAPYGHDGRTVNLMEVILRHGGEARESRNEFARLSRFNQIALIEFLNSLVIFPPDDTASNLDPGNPGATLFPQFGHGSVKLTVLFNDPTDIE